MTKTNCALAAWRQYVTGHATWIAMRQSNYSALRGKMPRLVRCLGRLIIYPAAGLWFAGHYLMFGTWPHFVYLDMGKWKEVTPKDDKRKRLCPPILFDPRED